MHHAHAPPRCCRRCRLRSAVCLEEPAVLLVPSIPRFLTYACTWRCPPGCGPSTQVQPKSHTPPAAPCAPSLSSHWWVARIAFAAVLRAPLAPGRHCLALLLTMHQASRAVLPISLVAGPHGHGCSGRRCPPVRRRRRVSRPQLAATLPPACALSSAGHAPHGSSTCKCQPHTHPHCQARLTQPLAGGAACPASRRLPRRPPAT